MPDPDAPPHPVVARLGARLQDARLNAGLTVRQVAEQLGLDTHTTLVRYESGQIRPPIDRLAELAAIYGMTLPALFIDDAQTAAVVALLEHADAQLIALIALLATASPEVIEQVTRLLRQQLATSSP